MDRPQAQAGQIWPPYLDNLISFLRAEERPLWDWFCELPRQSDRNDKARAELLKTSHRLDPASHPTVHQAAAEVGQLLGVEAPICLYQAESGESCNAGLAAIPDEVHLVFSGPVLELLDLGEMTALLGHELTHYQIWQSSRGECRLADQLLDSLCLSPNPPTAHVESARLFDLYGEIGCDRGALLANDDILAVVRMLLKVHTGPNAAAVDTDAEEYLKQAEQVCREGPLGSAGTTHPELFVRAHALRQWSESFDADKRQTVDARAAVEIQIQQLIEGRMRLEQLDLLQQRKVEGLTRTLIDAFLAPSWLRTEPLLDHARLYFDSYRVPDGKVALPPREQWEECDDQLRDYFCFVLLDFVTADPSLESYPLASALELAEHCGLESIFHERARRELRLRKGQLNAILEQKHRLLEEAAGKASPVEPS